MSTHRRVRGHRRVPRGGRTLTLRHGGDLKKQPTRVPTTRCLYGKRRYFTKGDAEMVLACLDRGDPRRRERRVYQCPACHGWHLTSQSVTEYQESRSTKPEGDLDVPRSTETVLSGTARRSIRLSRTDVSAHSSTESRPGNTAIRGEPVPSPGDVAARLAASRSDMPPAAEGSASQRITPEESSRYSALRAHVGRVRQLTRLLLIRRHRRS